MPCIGDSASVRLLFNSIYFFKEILPAIYIYATCLIVPCPKNGGSPYRREVRQAQQQQVFSEIF